VGNGDSDRDAQLRRDRPRKSLQQPGNKTAVGRCVYACPLFLDWNPIRLCVPSQNGLLLEPPQRHKDMTAMVVIGSPFSPLSTTDPFTM
jgi:hypothetical protein